MTLYVLPGAVSSLLCMSWSHKTNRSSPRLLPVRCCSPVSEGFNGQWVIPSFPCFHIVYGWCKLLMCSPIALICSFYVASGEFGFIHWKENRRLVYSCAYKGCSLTDITLLKPTLLHYRYSIFKEKLICLFWLPHKLKVWWPTVSCNRQWAIPFKWCVYFLMYLAGEGNGCGIKLKFSSFGKHTNVWYITSIWMEKWITLLERLLWLFWLFFLHHGFGSPLEFIVTTVNPSWLRPVKKPS